MSNIAKVIECVKAVLGNDKEIGIDTKLSDLAADSLSAVEIIMEVEKAFTISIPNDEADKVISIKDIVDIVEKQLTLNTAKE